MEKLTLQSRDVVGSNVERIAALFPQCVTEHRDAQGHLVRGIDFEKLKAELSLDLIGEGEERYQFTWPDKRAAARLANLPTNMTLRPCREESVDFDHTQNLYIEGDNLDVLKVLRETYLGRVKMIYIDPPYNTGNDFVYNDDFAKGKERFEETSGLFDEEGNQTIDPMQRNTESNGRFHTDWLNMIYPRLKVARDLLSEDGVIFISIDDNEVENLRKVCDEVFGMNNFVGQFIWRGGRRNLAKYISTSHEYMLCFAKNLAYISDMHISWNEKKKGLDDIYKKAADLVRVYENFDVVSEKLKEWYRSLPDDNESKNHSHYCWVDNRGVYFASDISRGGGGGPKWSVINPETGQVVQTPSRGWSYGKYDDLMRDIELGLIHFNGNGVPCKKRYLKDNETQVLETVFYKDRRGSSKRLRALLGGDYFPFPKDEEVIMHYVDSFTDSDSLILDFFSGSATTAHAVMKLNAEDDGQRKFIMVQLPELTDMESEAYQAGYKNICEIGKERIRRAGRMIKQEAGLQGQDLDIGFRVLKLDSSNMMEVNKIPQETDMEFLFADNVKPDRSSEDLLFQVMLTLGVELSASIEVKQMEGKQVFDVNHGYLVACFDEQVGEAAIRQIAQQKPYYFVMRDSSAESDSVIDNFEQLFRHYSPETICKII